MLRRMVGLCVMMCVTAAARGHFVWVVPETGGGKGEAHMFLSETLSADGDIDVAMFSHASLMVRDAVGHEAALAMEQKAHDFVALIKGGSTLIHGKVELGVMTMEADHPYLLTYYPKAITGGAFDGVTAGNVPVELVAHGKPGSLRFELLVNGKPKAQAEMTVLLPDGTTRKVKTGDDGQTPVFEAQGRYGVWARFWETVSGEQDGKKYAEARSYATLVLDAGKAAVAQPIAASRPADFNALTFAKLPEASASLGAVAMDGYLYVYGGHISPTHTYSTDAVSGKFNRLKLSEPGAKWEALAGGPPLQGMNLAAYGGKIYRVGGMQPLNKGGEPETLRSVADCAQFDPATKAWEPLPSLPEGRSSHDVAVVGNHLYVLGGWSLNTGEGGSGTKWMDTTLEMDLSAAKPAWKSLPQPFKRRALIAAVVGEKIYAIGGMDDKSEIVPEVAIYDSKAGTWGKGPNLPGDSDNGFSPAAVTLNGRLFVSVGDGSLWRLNMAGDGWEKIGASTPRIAHRLAAVDSRILVIGGAADGANFDLVEAVETRTGR